MNFTEEQAKAITDAIKELAIAGIEILSKAVLPVETENPKPEENEEHDNNEDKQDST